MSLASSRFMTLVGMRSLDAANALMAQSLTRLSTGLRINSAADDPAGLIVSQYLSSQLGSLQSAIDNTQRASSMVNTASDAVVSIASQLQSIRTLVLEIANGSSMTADEIAANQTAIDSAVEAINNLADGTSFGGIQLLDGSQAFRTSGMNTGQLADTTVHSARFGQAASLPVNINVTTSAQVAEVTHSGATLASATTLEVQGTLGTATLSFASGAAASAVVAGINADTANTGVSATLSGTDGIRMNSTTYGSSAFVSVSVVTGSFHLDSAGGTGSDTGRDAAATVNGTSVEGQGLKLTYSSPSLTFSTTLDETFGAGQVDTFYVTGGGMTFQIGATAASDVTIGISNMHAATLGGITGKLADIVSGGSTDATSNATDALKIVDEAIAEVSATSGRLGGFSTYTLEHTADVLQTTYTQLSTTYDNVVAADYAEETANYYRAQVLNSSSLTMLQIANQQAYSVLTLLSTLV